MKFLPWYRIAFPFFLPLCFLFSLITQCLFSLCVSDKCVFIIQSKSQSILLKNYVPWALCTYRYVYTRRHLYVYAHMSLSPMTTAVSLTLQTYAFLLSPPITSSNKFFRIWSILSVSVFLQPASLLWIPIDAPNSLSLTSTPYHGICLNDIPLIVIFWSFIPNHISFSYLFHGCSLFYFNIRSRICNYFHITIV